MTLTEHSSQLLDIEEIDLETLSLADLLRERADVKTEIQHISTQLVDPNRRPPAPEDDSPEWGEFRDWRRRARWALVYRKKELEDIKELLRQRQAEAHAERERRQAEAVFLDPESACHSAEEYAQLRASAIDRRGALLETLKQGDASDRLVLQLYRALRRMIGDGDGWPGALDSSDQEAIREASILLRSKYTSRGVRGFVARQDVTP